MKYLSIALLSVFLVGCDMQLSCETKVQIVSTALYSVGGEDLDALIAAAEELRQLYPEWDTLISDILNDVQTGVPQDRSEYASALVCESE